MPAFGISLWEMTQVVSVCNARLMMMRRMGICLLAWATYLMLPYFITVFISGAEGETKRPEMLEARRIRVEYQRGAKEMDVNQYITGVLLGWNQWLDLENENQEMIKLLSVMVRTHIYRSMGECWILEAGELSYDYYGRRRFLAGRGADGQKAYELVEDCIRATAGQVLCKDGACMEISWYEESESLRQEGQQGISLATAREMTRQGKSCEEVLQYFYKDGVCVKL